MVREIATGGTYGGAATKMSRHSISGKSSLNAGLYGFVPGVPSPITREIAHIFKILI
jgi:hypothetical protein